MRLLWMLVAIFGLIVPAYAAELDPSVTTSTLLIVNYDRTGRLLGWGTGFFVDEELAVTNRHVADAGAWHRVYATGPDGRVNLECYREVLKQDVLTNINDDVAYIRAVMPCEHGVLNFSEDPHAGDAVLVAGYPYRDSGTGSLPLTVTSGKVLGIEYDGWILTDAFMDFGNSGGPVTDGEHVLGIAVARDLDDQGNFLNSLFIPSSVVIRGLLLNSDPRFDYHPRAVVPRSVTSTSSASSMHSTQSSSARSSIARSSSSSSVSPFQARTCERVLKWFRGNKTMLDRVNARLQKRFEFTCK